MIAHLSGLVFKKSTQSLIVDAGGIGYEVFVPLSTYYTLPENNERVSLHIYTHVREDALQLFGFRTGLEKELFLLLISVSGIGPRLAVNILSGTGPQELLNAIVGGDSVRLQAIPGVGKKTAQRIALELKDRASRITTLEGPTQVPAPEEKHKGLVGDALSALLNLGYSRKLARDAVEKARHRTEDMTLEGLITEALKILA